MDRFNWAVALVALVLFTALVVAASLMTDPTDPPRVSCTGSATCEHVPMPTYNDDPIPPSTRSSQQ